MRPPHLLHLIGSPGRRVTSSWQAAHGSDGKGGRRQNMSAGRRGWAPISKRQYQQHQNRKKQCSEVGAKQKVAAPERKCGGGTRVLHKRETSGAAYNVLPLPHRYSVMTTVRLLPKRNWVCASRPPNKEAGEERR